MALQFDHELGVLIFDENASPVNPPSGNVGIYLNTSGEIRGVQNSGAILLPGSTSGTPTKVRITSNVTSTSTTLADITGLSFSLTSGTIYTFQFYILIQTTATGTGLFLSVNGPTFDYLAWKLITPTSGTTSIARYQSAYNAGAKTTGLTPANTNFLAVLEGTVKPNANGTLIARIASETGTSVSARADSCGLLYTI